MIEVEPTYDLYLFNDGENTESYVIQTLVHVMDHSVSLAKKLMEETHKKGKALIDTADKESLIEKRDLLVSFGLKAQICKS